MKPEEQIGAPRPLQEWLADLGQLPGDGWLLNAINLTLRQHTQAGYAVPRFFVTRLILNLTDQLARDNPKFNRTVFFNAIAKDLKVHFEES